MNSKQDHLLVSIVIPTYNRASLLLEALDSVKAQTYKDIEVVIVDDGSTDDTEAVVANYRGLNIQYYRLEKNVGYIGARNKGIELATGAYISFLDSDDRLLPTKIETLVNTFLQTGADLVLAGWRWMNFETGVVRVERIPSLDGRIKGLPRWGYNVVPDLVRADLVKLNGFRIEATHQENSEFLIRCYQQCRIAFVPEILSEYRDHHGLRASANIKGLLTGLEYIFQQHFDFIKKERVWVAEKYLSMALLLKKLSTDKQRQHIYFFNSIRLRPFGIRTWIYWFKMLLAFK